MERLYIYVCTYDQRQKDRHQRHLWLRAWATDRAELGLSKKQVSFKFTIKMFNAKYDVAIKSSKTLCQILELKYYGIVEIAMGKISCQYSWQWLGTLAVNLHSVKCLPGAIVVNLGLNP